MRTFTEAKKSSFRSLHFLIFAAAFFTLTACNNSALNSQNLSSSSTADEAQQTNADSKTGSQPITLNREAVIYFLDRDVLRPAGVLLPTAVVSILSQAQIVNPDYIDSKGQRQRSSTGFWGPVKIAKAIFKNAPIVPASELNSESFQLYVSATLSDLLNNTGDRYPALKSIPIQPNSEYLAFFNSKGKPLNNFTQALRNRFPGRLNKGVTASSLSPAEREKWNRIYSELKAVADRTVPANKQLLIADQKWANQASIDFENTGVIPPYGAWSVAVLGTATRRGFENVPCAEFMSEVLRQAYRRAGYSVLPDFSEAKTNPLIWYHTNRVQNLADSLNKAGWIPWDSAMYKPMTGSIVMHAQATSPGHTYMAAGFDGRLIIDNGAPQGRDLSTTVGKTIDMMFQTGVFFLPPGIQPSAW